MARVFEGELGFLRHDGDLLRDLAARQLIDRAIAEPHAAGCGPARAAQQAQQRRLAGTVRSEDAGERAVGEAERDAVDDQRPVGCVAERDVIGGKGQSGSPPRRLTRPR